MKKKFLTMLAVGLMACSACFAGWYETEQMEVADMQRVLLRHETRNVYLVEEDSTWAFAYINHGSNYNDLALTIAENIMPEQISYIYTNSGNVYSNLIREFNDFRVHRTFDGYNLMVDGDGSMMLNGRPVYRLWLMKVDQPIRIIRHHDNLERAVIYDILGLPFYRHEVDLRAPHRTPPPHYRQYKRVSPKHKAPPPQHKYNAPKHKMPPPQHKVTPPPKMKKPAPVPQKKVVVPAKPKPAPAPQKKVVAPAKPKQEMKKPPVMSQKHEVKKSDSKKQYETRPADKGHNPMPKGKAGKSHK